MSSKIDCLLVTSSLRVHVAWCCRRCSYLSKYQSDKLLSMLYTRVNTTSEETTADSTRNVDELETSSSSSSSSDVIVQQDALHCSVAVNKTRFSAERNHARAGGRCPTSTAQSWSCALVYAVFRGAASHATACQTTYSWFRIVSWYPTFLRVSRLSAWQSTSSTSDLQKPVVDQSHTDCVNYYFYTRAKTVGYRDKDDQDYIHTQAERMHQLQLIFFT